jgi:hypothetical protein
MNELERRKVLESYFRAGKSAAEVVVMVKNLGISRRTVYYRINCRIPDTFQSFFAAISSRSNFFDRSKLGIKLQVILNLCTKFSAK